MNRLSKALLGLFVFSMFNYFGCLCGCKAESLSYYVNNEEELRQALDNRAENILFCKDIYLNDRVVIEYPVNIDLQFCKIHVNDSFNRSRSSVIFINGERDYCSNSLMHVKFMNGVICNKSARRETDGISTLLYRSGERGADGIDTIEAHFARIRFEGCTVFGGNGNDGGNGTDAYVSRWFGKIRGGNGNRGGDGGSAVVLYNHSVLELDETWLFGGNGGNGGNGGDAVIDANCGNGGNGGNGGSAVKIRDGFLNVMRRGEDHGVKLQAGNGGIGGQHGMNRNRSQVGKGRYGKGGDGGHAVSVVDWNPAKTEGIHMASLIPGNGGFSNSLYGKRGVEIQRI